MKTVTIMNAKHTRIRLLKSIRLNAGFQGYKTSLTRRIPFSLFIAAATVACTPEVFAHDESSYPAAAETLPALLLVEDGKERSIRLTEIYDYHGGSCPGATMAFQALRYGLELLYDSGPIDVRDLLVIGRMPGGPMDFFDFIMSGSQPIQPTPTPEGMSREMNNFAFQFLRKSTMEAVTIELKEGIWPVDWFALKRKKQAGKMTDADKVRQLKNKRALLDQLLEQPLPEIFADPEVYSFVVWGQVLPGEIEKRITNLNTKNPN